MHAYSLVASVFPPCQDFQVRCDDTWFATFHWASVLFLVACILLPPLCIALCIHHYRHHLDETWIRCRLGFLYNGYRRVRTPPPQAGEADGGLPSSADKGSQTTEGGYGFPWWEVLVLFRRTAVSAISLLPSSVLQAVLAQAVFLMLLLAHVHCQPYQSMELNHLETVVLSALVVTQFGCVAVRP